MRKGKRLATKTLLAAVVGTVGAFGCGTATAAAQAVYAATVTQVTSGDTLTARTGDGRELSVRILGIDAPEARSPVECGGDDARDALEVLALDQTVEIETDPAVASVDSYGRLWAYVDRADGVDVGYEMVRRGWAAVLDDVVFQRMSDYLDAEGAAEGGVWRSCEGDFHLSRAEQLRAVRSSARAFVRLYYRRLSANRFATAWGMLGPQVRRKLGGNFRGWKASHHGSLGVSVAAGSVRLTPRRTIVRIRLRSRDRDVCSRRIVRQRFRGGVSLVVRREAWVVTEFRIHKTAGKRPRLSKSECPAPKPKPPSNPSPPSADCQGYDPCLPLGGDYDCAGGSGDGPNYVEGPVYVNGSDPYDLDGNGDGIGCES